MGFTKKEGVIKNKNFFKKIESHEKKIKKEGLNLIV